MPSHFVLFVRLRLKNVVLRRTLATPHILHYSEHTSSSPKRISFIVPGPSSVAEVLRSSDCAQGSWLSALLFVLLLPLVVAILARGWVGQGWMPTKSIHPPIYLFGPGFQSAQFGTEEKTHPPLYLSLLCAESYHYTSLNPLPLSGLVPFYVSTGQWIYFFSPTSRQPL